MTRDAQFESKSWIQETQWNTESSDDSPTRLCVSLFKLKHADDLDQKQSQTFTSHKWAALKQQQKNEEMQH